MLVEMIDSVDDADAAALCKQLRSLNAIEAICRLVDHEHETIHQLSLLLLGNLSSAQVDIEAETTRQMCKQCNALDKLLQRLRSTAQKTQMFATLALQNLCMNMECAEHVKAAGAIPQLNELAHSGEAQLQQYASGCLANLHKFDVISMLEKRGAKQIQRYECYLNHTKAAILSLVPAHG